MATEELFLRRGVVLVSGLVYWGGVFVQAKRVRRHIGKSPNLRPRGAKEQALWAGWLMVVAVWLGQPFLAGPAAAFSLTHFATFSGGFGLASGLALIVAGYAATLWCYRIMGDAWRIGINPSEKTPLVTRGPYGRLRHPIYAFQLMMLAGAALLLPTPLSLGVLLLHLICVLIKATDEEAYLISVHGQEYRDYCARTGRLLPKL
jgi:protein-S-isoprenylcysteine O-methyltransferase Ste14